MIWAGEAYKKWNEVDRVVVPPPTMYIHTKNENKRSNRIEFIAYLSKYYLPQWFFSQSLHFFLSFLLLYF